MIFFSLDTVIWSERGYYILGSSWFFFFLPGQMDMDDDMDNIIEDPVWKEGKT